MTDWHDGAYRSTPPGNHVAHLHLHLNLLVKNDSLIFHLEPLHGVLLGHPVLNPNTGLGPSSASYPVPGPLQHHEKVHSVDTRGRVVPAQQQDGMGEDRCHRAGIVIESGLRRKGRGLDDIGWAQMAPSLNRPHIPLSPARWSDLNGHVCYGEVRRVFQPSETRNLKPDT